MSDKMTGKVNEAVGATHKKLGDVTGNNEMEARGAAQEAKGHVQVATGKAKDNLHGAKKAAKKVAGR